MASRLPSEGLRSLLAAGAEGHALQVRAMGLQGRSFDAEMRRRGFAGSAAAFADLRVFVRELEASARAQSGLDPGRRLRADLIPYNPDLYRPPGVQGNVRTRVRFSWQDPITGATRYHTVDVWSDRSLTPAQLRAQVAAEFNQRFGPGGRYSGARPPTQFGDTSMEILNVQRRA